MSVHLLFQFVNQEDLQLLFVIFMVTLTSFSFGIFVNKKTTI